MTEDEAKTKWCPHARQAVVTSRDLASTATANRDGGEHYGADNCNCIGSACMAWRWLPEPPLLDGVNLVISWPPPPPTTGYCGLAGRP